MPASKFFTAYLSEHQKIEMGVVDKYVREDISVCVKQGM